MEKRERVRDRSKRQRESHRAKIGRDARKRLVIVGESTVTVKGYENVQERTKVRKGHGGRRRERKRAQTHSNRQREQERKGINVCKKYRAFDIFLCAYILSREKGVMITFEKPDKGHFYHFLKLYTHDACRAGLEKGAWS